MTVMLNTTIWTALYLGRRLHEGWLDPAHDDLDDNPRAGELAAAIAPAARGLLTLSQAEVSRSPELVRMLTPDDSVTYPHKVTTGGFAKLLVMFNDISCHDRTQLPEHAGIFGPQGQLNLQAVTLCIDHDSRQVQLGLVLPVLPANHPMARKDSLLDGYTVVLINRRGGIKATTVVPTPKDDGFLRQSLGLADGPKRGITRFSGRPLEDILGVDDARGFMADHLPLLGGYLSGLAGMIRLAQGSRR